MKQAITPSAWLGNAVLGDGWATFSGHSGDNAPHQHLAVQLVVAHKTNVRINIADQGEIESPAVVIAPNIHHRLLPGMGLLIYLDPESVLGHALTQRCVNGYLALDDSSRKRILTAALNKQGLGLIQATANCLSLSMQQPIAYTAPDRIEQLLASLPHRSELPKTLRQLAMEACLSPSRLRHRIVAIVGLPFRPYLRWLRLQKALKLATSGDSLTQAAHTAGFADAAHLSRTMQRHFGISPSTLLGAFRP